MAIRLVRAGLEDNPGSGVSSFASTAQSYAGGVGALSIIGVKWEGTATSFTVTDTAGNTYSYTSVVTDSGLNIRVAYCIGGTGNASNQITVTFSGGTADFVHSISENWSGIGSLDQSTSNHAASGTAVKCGALTPTDAYSLSWAFVGTFAGVNYTPTAGYLEELDGSDECTLYRINDRSASYNPSTTQTVNTNWCGIHLVFNGDGSAPDSVWLGSFGAKSTGNATSSSVAYPTGLQAGNLIVLCVPSKHANLPSASGFTQLAQVSDGSGTGGDTGSVVCTVFYKVSDGTESGNLSVTKTTETGSGLFGQMFRMVKWGGTWALASTTGTDGTTGTAVSVTGAGDPGVVVGDYVISAFADVSDIGNNSWTSPSITQTGVTFGDIEISQVNSDGIGDDMRLAVYGARATAGPSTAAPVFAATANGGPTGNSHRGAGAIVRLRSVAAPPPSMSPHPIFLLN